MDSKFMKRCKVSFPEFIMPARPRKLDKIKLPEYATLCAWGDSEEGSLEQLESWFRLCKSSGWAISGTPKTVRTGIRFFSTQNLIMSQR